MGSSGVVTLPGSSTQMRKTLKSKTLGPRVGGAFVEEDAADRLPGLPIGNAKTIRKMAVQKARFSRKNGNQRAMTYVKPVSGLRAIAKFCIAKCRGFSSLDSSSFYETSPLAWNPAHGMRACSIGRRFPEDASGCRRGGQQIS